MSQFNIHYKKFSGSRVWLRFAWEWTNPNGTVSAGRTYDNGAFAQDPDTTKHFTWKYWSPGKTKDGYRCVRGVLVDLSHANEFTTRVICIT